MNIIFFVCFVLASGALLFTAPEKILSALLSASDKAFKLTLTLTVIYAIWMGIIEILKRSGLENALSKVLNVPIRLVFGDLSPESQHLVSMNVSANILGLGGVATPYGISAVNLLDAENNNYAKAMLFVLTATSLQLLPTSIISLRDSFGSAQSADIIFPTLISTLVSTISGCVLVKCFVRKK